MYVFWVKEFNVNNLHCVFDQEESAPPLLLADTNPTAIIAANILKFNIVKHKRTRGTTSSTCVRRSVAQETPLPTYIGMMLHADTRKKELVDRLSHLGLSIYYDRVLQVSAQMGNSVCQQFRREHVVCPPKMRGEVFTTAAVDNIDHNPSATTSKDSFHGAAISLIQHPSYTGEGVDRTLSLLENLGTHGPRLSPLSRTIILMYPLSLAVSRSHLSQLLELRH